MKSIQKIGLSLFLMMGTGALAQELDANLQLRPRYEYRNGFKELMKDGSLPTSFVSQRSRLNFNFKQEKLKAKLTFQNIRVWGDVPTTTTSDKNGIALFEAWAQYDITPKWSARLGRQVISYDNQRIMGEIDWAQQGQSHDAALISFKQPNHQLDLGFALNSDAEKLYRDLYTISYKHMQHAWYHTNFDKLGMSLLALNVGIQYRDAITDELQVDDMQTFGTYLTYAKNKFDGNLGLYGQTGKAKLVTENTSVSAYYAGLNANYAFNTKIKAGLGYEYLSGKDQDDTDSKIKSFWPIFGTNHAFNGYMDYFYVGNYRNTVGLQDLFAKFTYNNNKWQFNAIPHFFMTAADVIDPVNPSQKMDSYLGTEMDLTASYTLQKDVMISGGYSQMFGTDTLEILKAGNKGYDNNWAWVMITINPRIFTTAK
ncbi:MAG TPA: alginate export family protein [Flavobacterium sp.]|uniref:alginate export family protein n=1 Tax=Flavobacterium sp. TaxID=239 RepID=UPI002B860787|nr:alginate export family protein [Flavobacterium sp.]HSD14937.1 alginate export family protein [Flavobacterium sp.]